MGQTFPSAVLRSTVLTPACTTTHHRRISQPAPMFADMPTSFIVCSVMWFVHGFILDIVVIGVLPFLSEAASDAQRADKFPWALGGYTGYPKVPNLAPTHRRFIAENAAVRLERSKQHCATLSPELTTWEPASHIPVPLVHLGSTPCCALRRPSSSQIFRCF